MQGRLALGFSLRTVRDELQVTLVSPSGRLNYSDTV